MMHGYRGLFVLHELYEIKTTFYICAVHLVREATLKGSLTIVLRLESTKIFKDHEYAEADADGLSVSFLIVTSVGR